MPITITGKKIIVTGAARGIAEFAARHFVAEGALVASFDVLDELGATVAAEATASGPGRMIFKHVDIADEAQVLAAVEAVNTELGGIDAVFNIAGIDVACLPEDMNEADWDRLLAVNVKGVAHVCQAVFPYLKTTGGAIINFSSDAGLMDRPVNSAAYAASKGAVISYTRMLAAAWGQYGIRVNTVNPFIKTPMFEEHKASLSPEDLEAYLANARLVPLGGDLGDGATDMAPALAFLASDASKFISGQIIGINGGYNSSR